MRYSQLRAFHHVALQGGFSAAAEVLGLTQPALSEQVRKLEQDHDALLFRRDRKRIVLTPTGEGLLRHTKQFFEAEDQIADYLAQERAVQTGTLRIIADSAHHITGALEAFRLQYPRVFVTLQGGNSEDVLNALRNYDAEIGVLGSVQTGTDMTQHDLGTSPIIAFAEQSFAARMARPRRLSDLTDQPLVFREKGSKTRQKLQEIARQHGLRLRPVVEVEGREAMREVVASGAGIGFVSEAEFGHDARLVKLPLNEPDLQMSETLTYLKQRADLRVIRQFAALL